MAGSRHRWVTRVSEHRVKGALIGGALLGLTLAVVGSQLCDAGESCTKTTVLFRLLGATVGAVVGGMVAGDGKQEGSYRNPPPTVRTIGGGSFQPTA